MKISYLKKNQKDLLKGSGAIGTESISRIQKQKGLFIIINELTYQKRFFQAL